MTKLDKIAVHNRMDKNIKNHETRIKKLELQAAA